MKEYRVALIVAAVLTGCGSPSVAAPGPVTPTPHVPSALPRLAAWVHVSTPAPDGTLQLVGFAGSVLRTLPGGQLTGDGARELTTMPDAGGTHLRILDARTGGTLSERILPAGFHLPRLGPARWAASLAPGDAFAALDDRPQGARPGTVRTTHAAVVDLATGGGTRLIALSGDFEVDALSSDGQQLYLIETLPPVAGGSVRYHVRRVDVMSGTLDPTIVVDKTDGLEAMAGVPLSRVTSSGGWALTAYGLGPHGSFVHGLGLDAKVAVCVDLPKDTRGRGDAGQLMWSLAGDASGNHVVAINGGTGQVVALESAGGPPTVVRRADLPRLPNAGRGAGPSAGRTVSTGAVLSPDGRTLYAVALEGIIVVDVRTLTQRGTLASGLRVSGLAISPDGSTLLSVGEAGGVDLVDVRTGTLATLRMGQAGVDAVLRVVAAA